MKKDSLLNYDLDILLKNAEKEPWNFSLYRLLFLLEKKYKDKKRFSYGKSRKEEPAFLNGYNNMSVPSSDFVKFSKDKGDLINLTLNHTSLLGVNSPLPQGYIEKIIQEKRGNNSAIEDFLNIFNHRWFSLLYKMEKKNEISLENDLHSHDLFNMNKGISGALLLKDWSQVLSPFANVFWQKTKNFTNLKKILESIFNFKFEIDQFQEQKILVEDDCQASLKNCSLSNKILGKYATSVQNKISISIYMDSLKDYLIIVLNKNHLEFIFKVVEYYVPSFISVAYKFFLNPKSKPECSLNGALFLNKNAWLGKKHISNYAAKI